MNGIVVVPIVESMPLAWLCGWHRFRSWEEPTTNLGSRKSALREALGSAPSRRVLLGELPQSLSSERQELARSGTRLNFRFGQEYRTFLSLNDITSYPYKRSDLIYVVHSDGMTKSVFYWQMR